MVDRASILKEHLKSGSSHRQTEGGFAAFSALVVSLEMAKLTRTLVLPPGTPQGRVKVLRQGIRRMAQDPGFIADWKIFGQKLAPALVDSEEADRIKIKVMKPAPWQEYLRKFVWG